MPWYRIHFPPELVLAGEPERLKEDFQKCYQSENAPPGMFLVADCRAEYPRTYYLSPNSEIYCYDLLETYLAEAGFPPVGSESAFLAGDPNASENQHHPSNAVAVD